MYYYIIEAYINASNIMDPIENIEWTAYSDFSTAFCKFATYASESDEIRIEQIPPHHVTGLILEEFDIYYRVWVLTVLPENTDVNTLANKILIDFIYTHVAIANCNTTTEDGRLMTY